MSAVGMSMEDEANEPSGSAIASASAASATAAKPEPRQALWNAKDPAVDAALRSALLTCRPEERPELVRVILDRGDRTSLMAVIESQDAAGPEEAAWVREAAADRLDGALRTLLERAETAGAGHALRLIREARLGRLAYLLTDVIRRGRKELPETAAAILIELCETASPNELDAVRSAIDTAVARFDRHRHPGVIEAYLRMLPAPMPAAMGALSEPGHPAGLALGQRLAKAETASDRRALLPLSACPVLHPAIRTGLTRCRDATAWSDVLQNGHMLAEPAAATLLAEVPGSDAAKLGLAADLATLPPTARRWMPMLWSRLPFEPCVLLERLASVAGDEDPGTRVAAVRVLAYFRPTAETIGSWSELLVRFGHDPDAGIARAAAAILDRAAARSEGPGTSASQLQPTWAKTQQKPETALPDVPLATVSRLATSPHAAVRASAGRRIGPGAFERVWNTWERLEPTRRAATLFALRKLDPGFDDRLLRRLRHADPRRDPLLPDQRLRALAWVRALACPSQLLADAASALCGDGDPKLAASAVMALAVAKDEHHVGTSKLLRTMTRHPDDRVRANAIEALDRRPAADALDDADLESLIQDDSPRVRANALLALFRREGQPALRPITDMLRDPRPEHRRSALWLAGVTGLLDAVDAQRLVSSPAEETTEPGPARNDAPNPDAAPSVADLLRALDDALAHTSPDHGAAA